MVVENLLYWRLLTKYWILDIFLKNWYLPLIVLRYILQIPYVFYGKRESRFIRIRSRRRIWIFWEQQNWRWWKDHNPKIRIEDDNNVTYLFNEVRNNLNIYFINSYEQTLLKNEELSAIAENLRTYLDVLIFKQIYQRNSKLVNVYEQVKESVDQLTWITFKNRSKRMLWMTMKSSC